LPVSESQVAETQGANDESAQDKRNQGNRTRNQRRRRANKPSTDQPTAETGVAPDTEETQAPASIPAFEASAPNAVVLQDSINPPPVRSETSDDTAANKADDTATNEADGSVKVESQETEPEKPTIVELEQPVEATPTTPPSAWGKASNDPRVDPKARPIGPVTEDVVIVEQINELPYLPVVHDDSHPSRWQRAGNDPRNFG
jgi:hypothetical protein